MSSITTGGLWSSITTGDMSFIATITVTKFAGGATDAASAAGANEKPSIMATSARIQPAARTAEFFNFASPFQASKVSTSGNSQKITGWATIDHILNKIVAIRDNMMFQQTKLK
jgi:hypothetical protein